MTARPIRYQRQVSDRKGKIFYTSITSLSHISKISGVEAAEIEGKGHRVCLPFQKLSKLIQIYHTGKV